MNKIFLSIIIPTHNSRNTIAPLLLSINNSPTVDFRDLEVIVVDDESKDNTVNVVENVRKILKYKLKLIEVKRNIGPAKARNTGAKKAVGRYFLFLDGDVKLKTNTLHNVFKLIKTDKIRAFTGIWDYHQKSTNFFPQFKALRDWSYWFAEREENSHYYLFSTRIAGIEKKLFHKLNGFIEDYNLPTVEDIEFTYRIEKQSPIKFCSNIVVNHEFEDFYPIARKYFMRSRDWIKLYLKRFRFDPVATSKREALKSVLSSIILGSIFLTFFVRIFLVPTIILFLIYSYLELKFWSFILYKKGLLFLLQAIPTSFILYQFINVGAAWGYLISVKNRK